MSNIYFYVLLALIAGTMMPTQAAANNKMATVVGSPILAAFISFFVGTVVLFVYAVVTGESLGNIASARNAPPVAWIGGFFGAFFVTAAVTLVPRLGVAMTFSLIVAGQMLVTLVLDHFGFLGMDQRSVTWPRILGVLLITGGVVLIRRF
jgi:transporter family-2 protein